MHTWKWMCKLKKTKTKMVLTFFCSRITDVHLFSRRPLNFFSISWGWKMKQNQGKRVKISSLSMAIYGRSSWNANHFHICKYQFPSQMHYYNLKKKRSIKFAIKKKPRRSHNNGKLTTGKSWHFTPRLWWVSQTNHAVLELWNEVKKLYYD